MGSSSRFLPGPVLGMFPVRCGALVRCSAAPATAMGTQQCLLQFDGGSRGNTRSSIAGAGAVLFARLPPRKGGEGGSLAVAEATVFMRGTNNEAEYTGLLAGLQMAQRYAVEDLQVEGDSELVVKQVKGLYKVRKPHLVPLFDQVMGAVAAFPRFSIRHIPREQNAHADRLANRAMDRRRSEGPTLLTPDFSGGGVGQRDFATSAGLPSSTMEEGLPQSGEALPPQAAGPSTPHSGRLDGEGGPHTAAPSSGAAMDHTDSAWSAEPHPGPFGQEGGPAQAGDGPQWVAGGGRRNQRSRRSGQEPMEAGGAPPPDPTTLHVLQFCGHSLQNKAASRAGAAAVLFSPGGDRDANDDTGSEGGGGPPPRVAIATAGPEAMTGTANEAEYRALIAGLRLALARHVAALLAESRSELVVRQMAGQYKVRAAALAPLYHEAAALAGRLRYFDIRHVSAARPVPAEELARRACAEPPAGSGGSGGGAGPVSLPVPSSTSYGPVAAEEEPRTASLFGAGVAADVPRPAPVPVYHGYGDDAAALRGVRATFEGGGEGGGVLVQLRYDFGAIAALKRRVPGLRFVLPARKWLCPPASAPALLHLLHDAGAEIPAAVRQAAVEQAYRDPGREQLRHKAARFS